MKIACTLLLLSLAWLSALPLKAQVVNALPVLVNINASLAADNKVMISWTILAKVNTDYFEVQRSNDGISWTSVATVIANNNAPIPTAYAALDASPEKGTNFYKIRLKDLNGNISFTGIKSVLVNGTGGVQLYPNPCTSQVTVSIGQFPHKEWSFALYNGNGQLLLRQQCNKNINTAILPVYGYATGNYIVETVQGSSRQTTRLMINHK